jgi:putative spermidine/putrescine transport system permease protein
MLQNNKPIYYVLPAVIVVVFLFFGGLIEGLMQSLGYWSSVGQHSISFDAYHRLLISYDFWYQLMLTLRMAFLSTLLAGVIGVSLSIWLYMLSSWGGARHSGLWLRLLQLPLTIPHLVGAYMMVLLFMQSGWLSRLSYAIGWTDSIDQFPILINDTFGWGIILTYAWKETPFVILMIWPLLHRIQSQWLFAARVHGANSWSYVKEIVVPLLVPVWGVTSFILFAFTVSAFEIPYLLGVTYPKLLPNLSYELYMSGERASRQEAMAVNMILTLITICLGMIAYRLSKRWRVGELKGWL